jgi:hypothetical protein
MQGDGLFLVKLEAGLTEIDDPVCVIVQWISVGLDQWSMVSGQGFPETIADRDRENADGSAPGDLDEEFVSVRCGATTFEPDGQHAFILRLGLKTLLLGRPARMKPGLT